MKKLTPFLAAAILALLMIAFPARSVTAQDLSSQTPPAPLCLPGQDVELSTCQTSGPAAYLREQAALGLTLPRNPLPAVGIDPAFGELPYTYIRLHKEETPLFRSSTDAATNAEPYRIIPPGFSYVSIVDYSQGAGGGRNYMIDPGIWVRGGHTSGRAAPSEFTGLLFAGTPSRQFGWVIYQAESQAAPGADESIPRVRTLYKFDIIQVYQTVYLDGADWLMIGPDEWVDKSVTGLVYPAESPPDGVANGRWIEVNLLEQTVSVYQDNRLIFATLTSTGIPGWWTRPGLFQITEKLDTTPMSGFFEADRSDYYYLEDVPWTMYFDQARALHGAYWHNYFGYEQSHGCVNLSPADSHWLYLWATEGDYVYVWDPSGKTPTDESLYTAGGA